MWTDPVPSKTALPVPDRRRHVRYRLAVPITVYRKGAPAVRGISVEISESGMSALVGDELAVGDTVDLEPVAGSRISALIRRQMGKIFGFEFLNLTSAQIQRIGEICATLPHYQSKTLDI